MQRIKSLTTALDVFGTGALLGSAIALTALVGQFFTFPEAETLRLFMSMFGASLGAFALARTLQIGHLMRTRVDPRRARRLRAAEVEALPQADTSSTVPNPFQRAA